MSNRSIQEGLVSFQDISNGQVIKYHPNSPVHVIVYKLRDNNASDAYSRGNLEFVTDVSAANPSYQGPIMPRRKHVRCHVDLRPRSITHKTKFFTQERMTGEVNFRLDYKVINPYNVVGQVDVLNQLAQRCQDKIEEKTRQLSYQHIRESTIQNIVLSIFPEDLGLSLISCSVNGLVSWEGVAQRIVHENSLGRIERQVDTDLEREQAQHQIEMDKLRAEREKIRLEISTEKNYHELMLRTQKLRALGISDPNMIMLALSEVDDDLKKIMERIDGNDKESKERLAQHYKRMSDLLADKNTPDVARMRIVKDFIEQANNEASFHQNRRSSNQPLLSEGAFTLQHAQQHPLPSMLPPNQQQQLNAPQLLPPNGLLQSPYQQYQLTPSQTYIGRSEQNHIMLPDPKVSSVHAIVKYDNGHYYVQDQRSANGTYVSGSQGNFQVPSEYEMEIYPGDTIILGDTNLRFVIGNQGPQQGFSGASGRTQVDG